MRNIYKKSLNVIAILIVICALLGISYLFYDKVIIDSGLVVDADGELSTNYLNGKIINHDGEYQFSVTNNSNKDIYFEIAMLNYKKLSNDIRYDLVSSEANISLTNISIENDQNYLADNILIKSKMTQNFSLRVNNINDTSITLAVRKISYTEEYFFTTILNSNVVKKKATTSIASETATESEGLIENIDDYGLTYYFRGDVPNNYVSFAGFTWRIIRINGDGTVRLILNNAIDELSRYHSEDDGYEDFENTTIQKNLESFYNTYLKKYDNYIANSKFCIENGSTNDKDDKIYNSYTRITVNGIPTFNCLGEKYKAKIGLITADEVVYAGATTESENKKFYLYNEEIEDVWWTSSLAKTKDGSFYPFSIQNDGKLIFSTKGTVYRNLRPVINLTKNVIVSGSGVLTDPYEVSTN